MRAAPKYRVGETVIFINDNGVNFGERKITKIADNITYSANGYGYYLEPTDTPWFAHKEENLRKVKQ